MESLIGGHFIVLLSLYVVTMVVVVTLITLYILGAKMLVVIQTYL